jgi:hypothetical protein
VAVALKHLLISISYRSHNGHTIAVISEFENFVGRLYRIGTKLIAAQSEM